MSPNLAQKCITGGTHYHNFGSRIFYELVGKFLNFIGVLDDFDELFFDTLVAVPSFVLLVRIYPTEFRKNTAVVPRGSDVAPNRLCWRLTLICRRACTIAFSIDYAKISFDFFEMSQIHTLQQVSHNISILLSDFSDESQSDSPNHGYYSLAK